MDRSNVPFAIFRFKDAAPEAGIGIMRTYPLEPAALAGAATAMQAGIADGSENRLLFAGGGLSLSYAWFKSFYPLPRHTHDGDCLYHILAGSLRIGTEDLGPGDGFLVGAGTPYAYTAGPAGVEVLEFRSADTFDLRMLANNPAFWQRAAATVTQHRDSWHTERRPSGLA